MDEPQNIQMAWPSFVRASITIEWPDARWNRDLRPKVSVLVKDPPLLWAGIALVTAFNQFMYGSLK